ncbi:hypothetical protein COLO4_20724 [Corchorus olitorius]|uniref:Uncharacterized protein n=1 Tax=Corchorus olitorius TaxID=93759 RepID=A0A1R3IXD4_9ROSI|nr:hypothetical protein COLO4_20724 [Corchorus olitorius]
METLYVSYCVSPCRLNARRVEKNVVNFKCEVVARDKREFTENI